MTKFLDYVKKHVKVTLAVVALGFGITFALNADGCSVGVDPAPIAVPVAE